MLNNIIYHNPSLLEHIRAVISTTGYASNILSKNAKSIQFESFVIHFGGYPQHCQWHKTQRTSRRRWAIEYAAIGVRRRRFLYGYL
jgi:hypothetical protein